MAKPTGSTVALSGPEHRSPSVTDGELVARFAETEEVLGLAPRTRQHHRAAIADLARRLADSGIRGPALLDVTPREVGLWLGALQGNHTIRRERLEGVSAFYAWAQRSGLVAVNPAEGLVAFGPRGAEHLTASNDPNMAVLTEWRRFRASWGRTDVEAFRLVMRFGRWLAPTPVLEATRSDVTDWLLAVNVGPSARRCYLSMLRSFYRWCLDEERIIVDPTRGITPPKMGRRLPRPMDEEALEQALAEAPPRIRAYLALAAFGGLRCMEIATLRREHIIDHCVPPLIHITKGKGSHQRLVPLHPEVAAALACLPMPRAGWLFPHAWGGDRPVTAHTVSVRANTYLHGLGIAATIHQCRHRFATKVYEVSRDIRVTQELMGHASPDTTAVYAAWSPATAAEAVMKLKRGKR